MAAGWVVIYPQHLVEVEQVGTAWVDIVSDLKSSSPF